MRSHPRIRKTIKWGGAAAAVLLLMAWGASGFGDVYWGSPSGYIVRVTQGNAIVMVTSPAPPGPSRSDRGYANNGKVVWNVGWYYSKAAWFHLNWMPWREPLRGMTRAFIIPLYLPVGVASIVCLAAWCLDARARWRVQGLCPKCRYDREGLAKDAVCPECGSKWGPA